MASGSASNPLHISEPSSGNVSSEGNSVPQVNQTETFDAKYPLWKYVKKIGNNGPKGGNCVVECTFCGKQFNGSYTRIRGHLLKVPNQGVAICREVTVPILEQLRKEVVAADLAINSSRPNSVPLPVHLDIGSTGLPPSGGTSAQSKNRKKQQGIDESFYRERRQIADAFIGRMFYTGGVSFNLARNPNFKALVTYLANTDLGGYVPPGYNKLRITLLQQERLNVERLLEPCKTMWPVKGVTITSDGWTDPQRRPLINFIAVNEDGPMFLGADNTEGDIKRISYIADKLISVIENVGPKNVVQVITDNAPNCKGAGLIVEQKYDHIFWTPCVVHTLNLALKNICDANANDVENAGLMWIKETVESAFMIKNYIMNHGMRLSMFNEYSKLKFFAVADTRFASHIVMLRRFLTLKESLVLMVVGDKWTTYREDDVEKARAVKQNLLDDCWWDKVKYIVDFTEPIYSMLRAADTDKPCLHLIYEMWNSMIEKVKETIFRHERKQLDEESTFYDTVYAILYDRWLKSNTSLHCLAHSLNPRYYSQQWLSEVPNRVAPHEDIEVSDMRNKCFRKMFPNPEDLRTIKRQFADFSLFGGGFADRESIEDRALYEPKQWWGLHGRTPELKALALKLLGQPASSSACERNWSTYGFIDSALRNKLTPPRAEDLVFVHSNMCLLSTKSDDYKKGPTQMWDVGADNHETFSGAGILEHATLSLDEPELEGMLFEDEGGESSTGI